MDLFVIFSLTDYEFLEISRGEVYGNRIIARIAAQGVFKLRRGVTTSSNEEYPQSSATIHIKPTESFITSNLVGQGIEVDGSQYEIVGMTKGVDFVTGQTSHYTLTLQSADFAEVS